MIRNLCTCGAYSIRPYPDGRKRLYLRSIWDYAKQYNLLFDLENVHAESIIPILESRKSYAKRHDPFFDQTETYAKCIDILFESKNSYAKYHDPFFDMKNDHEKFHIFLFDLKNSHAKWLEKISERCFWEMFLRYLFQGIFFLCCEVEIV